MVNIHHGQITWKLYPLLLSEQVRSHQGRVKGMVQTINETGRLEDILPSPPRKSPEPQELEETRFVSSRASAESAPIKKLVLCNHSTVYQNLNVHYLVISPPTKWSTVVTHFSKSLLSHLPSY